MSSPAHPAELVKGNDKLLCLKVVRNRGFRSLTPPLPSTNLTPEYQASETAGPRQSPALRPGKGFFPDIKGSAYPPDFEYPDLRVSRCHKSTVQVHAISSHSALIVARCGRRRFGAVASEGEIGGANRGEIESSLASTNQMREFLGRLASQDRVLLIGDIRQHQGVEAGRPFEQLQEAGAPRHPVNDGLPQGDPVERRAGKGERRFARGLHRIVFCVRRKWV